jgi:phosphoglycolate phosphatase-like HAD superfamily hydrolase
MERVRTLLALDFDGVICDSLEECFLSSWIAYHELYSGEARRDPPQEARRAFARLRPFIRTGEDYLVIQDLAARAEEVAGQEGFDAAARRAGADTLRLFRELFYRARDGLLEGDRRAWLGLNRIYPHMAGFLAGLPLGAPVWILSTKKPRFIVEILAANGINMPADRIREAVREPKLVILETLRAAEGASIAVLIEDQIDAIKGNANPRIRVGLATWGYVKEEWLAPPLAVPLVTPEGFLRLAAEALGSQ